MNKFEKQEEQNKRIGWITSVSVQLILLIVCYLIIAWKEPYPPIPEYGIELSLSTSSGGSQSNAAAAQQESPRSDTKAETDVIPVEQQEVNDVELPSEVEEVSAEIAEEPVERPTTEQETSVNEINEVAEVTESSDVVVEKQVSEPVEKEVEEEKDVTKPEVKEKTKPEPKVDSRAVMGGGKDSKEGQSEGETEELDQRAILGGGDQQGQTEGASLAMSGWRWDLPPKPDDTSDATGKIVYEISVKADGYLATIPKLLVSTVPPEVERKYREAVEKLSFSKTTNDETATISKGKITFIITSK